MVSIRFDRPQTIVPHRARSYFRAGAAWRNQYYNDLRYKFASGAMLASVEDLVRFGAALNAGALLYPQTRRRMFQPHAVGVPMFGDRAAPGRRPRQQGQLWDLRDDDAGGASRSTAAASRRSTPAWSTSWTRTWSPRCGDQFMGVLRLVAGGPARGHLRD
jgi:hypothetical protein